MSSSRLAVQFVAGDHPAVVAAGRHGLPEDVADRRPPVHLASGDVDGVRLVLRTDRVAGLAVGAFDTGEITADPTVVDAVRGDWYDGLKASVIVEALLVRTAERLDGLGVRWAVTKGAAVAHLDYPDPALRCFADVDIVVHPDDWTAVVDAVAGQNKRMRARRRFTRLYGKGETVTVDGMELDLHRRFAVGRFGVRSEMVDCFDRLESFTLAGRHIPTLTSAFRLVHACFHAVLGGSPGVRALRDVVQIATADPAVADEAREVARRWRVEAVMAQALIDSWTTLDLNMDHDLVVAARATSWSRADAAALAVFSTDPRFRRQASTGVAALPWGRRPGFILAAAAMAWEARR